MIPCMSACVVCVCCPLGSDALEGKGPQRGLQKRLGRRLEEVANTGGDYCRLQMPLRLALGDTGTVAGRRLGALEGGGGGGLAPLENHEVAGAWVTAHVPARGNNVCQPVGVPPVRIGWLPCSALS